MISVAMTTYNGENFVLEQINSIFNQTRNIDELIIVDDHSSDQTIPIILHLMQEHPDWPIKVYVNTKNLGYKRNFEKAIALSSGDHIFLSDQDDVWMENKVEEMMRIMEMDPQIEVLASSFDLIDQDGCLLEIDEDPDRSNHNFLLKKVEKDSLTPMSLEEFAYHNYFQGCALVMTKKIRQLFLENFTDIIPHDWLINMLAAREGVEEFAYHNYFQGCALVMTKKIRQLFLENFTDIIPHDWLINMLAAREGAMMYYDHPLFKYRIHEQNTIGMTGEVEKGIKAKWDRMNDLKIRQQFAKERVESLTALEKVDPDFFAKHEEYVRMRDFCKAHCTYLEKKQFFRLLFQNADPNYKLLKPWTARMYDLVFALQKGK